MRSAEFSRWAVTVAGYLVKNSVTRRAAELRVSPDELRRETGLTDEELALGVDQLVQRGLVTKHAGESEGPLSFRHLTPGATLFELFDPVFNIGTALSDARKVASACLADRKSPVDVGELAHVFDWSPRRMNAAISVLLSMKLVQEPTGDERTWVLTQLRPRAELATFAAGGALGSRREQAMAA